MTTETTLQMPNEPELSEWYVTADGQLIKIAVPQTDISKN